MVGTTKDFWKAAESVIAVTEKHPFLVAMVDGSLSLEKFRYYVVQDVLYLNDFAAALRILSQNSGVSKADAQLLEEFATHANQAELSLHGSFFQEWNIDATGVPQMPNTLLYTSYILRVVATRPHAEGLAALLPCFWVYTHVGEEMLKLRATLGAQDRAPQFDAWIDMYGGEAFQKEVHDYIALVDAACVTASPETLAAMEEHFVMCCKLEHMFWDQANDLLEWPAIGK